MNWPHFLVYAGTRAGAGLCFFISGFSMCAGETFLMLLSGLSGGFSWLCWKWYEEKDK